jgi:predicted dinucleotide-binding enzyme
MRYLESDEGCSGSERLQPHLSESVHIVAAFKTISAYALYDANLEDPVPPLDCNEFVASDSKKAKLQVIKAMQFIEGLQPIDAGSLENARSIERLTVLIISLNRLKKKKTGRYRIVGL